MKDVLTKEKINEIIEFHEKIDSLLKSYLAFEKDIICDNITWRLRNSGSYYFRIEYVDKNYKPQSLCINFEDINNTLMKKYVS